MRPEKISIPVYLILTFVTLGLFNLYWNYRQMQACNAWLERTEFIFWQWIVFSIITFGLYHIFYQYKMGAAIVEIQRKQEKRVTSILPLLSGGLTALALSIVVDCLHQYELNKILED